MGPRPSSTSPGQTPPLLHLQLSIRPQRRRVAAPGEPGLCRGVALEVGVPEGRGALENQVVEARVLLALAGLPSLAGENHVVTALEDHQVLAGGLNVIERDAA